jgi:hypothetical protein
MNDITDEARYERGSGPREHFNWLSLICLIAALTGFGDPIVAPLAFAASIGCLIVISRIGGRGRGLAIASIILSGFCCIVYAAGLALHVKL